MERSIIYSGLQTPDGTIIESKHRHDYVVHEDKNGKEYMLDGGHDYVRYTLHGDEKLITIYDDEPFEKIREYFKWGRNYDANMNRLPKTEWVLLKDLKTDHIDRILESVKTPGYITRLFLLEKQHRHDKTTA